MSVIFALLAVGALAGIFAAVRHLRQNDTTPISSVHAGKKDTHTYKFDVAETRRRSFRPRPRISTANLPAPDPRVAAVLKQVLVANIEKSVKELSGESDATVAGAKVRILSRNSFSKGLDQAMTYLEEFYASLGIPTRRVQYKWRGRTMYNLEATIAGTVNADQVLIVGSHLDSTAGNTWSAERVAPGADDDASGTVANMELARALVALRTAGATIGCTVRLLHFTGEEQGLWGSYTYSDLVHKEGTNVIAMLQMDMIGYCAKPGNRLDLHDDVNRNGAHSLVELFVRNIARYGLNLTGFDTHDHAVRDRSDHAGFADHGVMALCISEEFTEGPGGGFNPNYHSTGDRIAAMNLPYMADVIRLLIASVADLAQVK